MEDNSTHAFSEVPDKAIQDYTLNGRELVLELGLRFALGLSLGLNLGLGLELGLSSKARVRVKARVKEFSLLGIQSTDVQLTAAWRKSSKSCWCAAHAS